MCKTTPQFLPSLQQLNSMAPSSPYAYWLREATKALAETEFGLWYPSAEDTPPGQITVPPSEEDEHYDRRFWISLVDAKYGKCLELKGGAGRTAAKAIKAILEFPQFWNIDCDYTVQISNLYAMSETLGAEKFNELVGPQ